MKTLSIDVMTEGGVKFYRSLRVPFNPLFKADTGAIERYIYSRCPLLKYERDVVLFIDN